MPMTEPAPAEASRTPERQDLPEAGSQAVMVATEGRVPVFDCVERGLLRIAPACGQVTVPIRGDRQWSYPTKGGGGSV